MLQQQQEQIEQPEVLIYDIESQNNQPPLALIDEPEPYPTQLIKIKPVELEPYPNIKPTRQRRQRKIEQTEKQKQIYTPLTNTQESPIAISTDQLFSPSPRKLIPQQQPEDIIFYQESLVQSQNSVFAIETTTRGLLQQHQQSSSESYQESQEGDQVGELPNKLQIHSPTLSLLVQATPEMLLFKPVPPGYKLKLQLKIERNVLGFASVYRLFLTNPQQFLISSKKEFLKYYSNFLLSGHPYRISTRKNYLGRVEGNFLGTKFKIYSQQKSSEQRLECLVDYHKNIAGIMGPRAFTAQKIKIPSKKGEKLEEVVSRQEKSKIIQLMTESPAFVRGKYRLDFQGKVRIPSPKNFILQAQGQRSLLFGKTSENNYLVEVGHPLTVLEAFGICLSSLDKKILVN